MSLPGRWAALASLGAILSSCAPPSSPDPGSEIASREVLCGDGFCDLGEDCASCGADCGACAASCFDGVCQLHESCQRCPADCGTCVPGDAPNPDAEPDAEPDPSPAPGVLEAWADKELAMLALVNQMRTEGGDCPSGAFPPVPALAMDAALRAAAREHALDMGERGYFDHITPEGIDPWQRIDAAGYDGFATGENIAGGNAAAEDTFEQWRHSDGHCRNMMSDGSAEIGVGYAAVDGSPLRHYWVQTFGRP